MESAASRNDALGHRRTAVLHPAAGWALRLGLLALAATLAVLLDADPVWAQTTTETVTGLLNRIRNWIIGLAGLFAVIMATIAGVRYMLSSDPAQTEKAKGALRAAAVGLGLVLFAPVLIRILEYLVGSHAYE